MKISNNFKFNKLHFRPHCNLRENEKLKYATHLKLASPVLVISLLIQ